MDEGKEWLILYICRNTWWGSSGEGALRNRKKAMSIGFYE